ncbi:MAG: hypothetical protein AB7V44_02460 [Pseudonocardia sp.]
MDTLALLALAALAGYVIVCAVWPFGPCRRCSGTGKRRSPTGRYWRPCGRCGGSGRRVRLGRALYELIREAE